MPRKYPRFVFTVGGVLSGLGKGATTASIGLLLKSRGFSVTALKIDPYISIDAGTMRPAEHGEVFVTRDGGEIDQDLGQYERLLGISLTKDHNITTGKVFQGVIQKERVFYYGGRDAEMIPDLINEIKEHIFKPLRGEEIVLVEIGGTTGDLENLPFLYAARELARDYHAIFVMIVYVPFLKTVGELKTKPAQHAIARLREVGIFPDILVTRAEMPVDKPRLETLAKRCFLDSQDIIDSPDLDCVYRLPLLYQDEGLLDRVTEKLKLPTRKKDFSQWRSFVCALTHPQSTVTIALVGKYLTHGAAEHRDVYISVVEALNHAAAARQLEVRVVAVDSEQIETKGIDVLTELKPDGIVVPQGWGSRGVEGKIAAARYARENRIPYLGLCFGMQMAVIEFARHVAGLAGANSTEADPETPHPVIHLMPEQEKYLKEEQYGGTTRLGSWPCELNRDSRLFHAYQSDGWFKQATAVQAVDELSNKNSSFSAGKPRRRQPVELHGLDKKASWWEDRDGVRHPPRRNTVRLTVYERHRHRYEFNNAYREKLVAFGLRITGTSPDGKLVEAVEIVNHPFFVGVQFHPEYQSRPLAPHPIFISFLAQLTTSLG